jgi:hypothetical protein
MLAEIVCPFSNAASSEWWVLFCVLSGEADMSLAVGISCALAHLSYTILSVLSLTSLKTGVRLIVIKPDFARI